CASGSSFDYW
nr:immunoglobulin heavy chain junction region [Mus musculus]MBK4196310.1 immunoglobulin heavy chain junction region [Mus musculus]MBK4196311.1 immunoglobulin heavy chain junction region [Mus musculus]